MPYCRNCLDLYKGEKWVYDTELECQRRTCCGQTILDIKKRKDLEKELKELKEKQIKIEKILFISIPKN